MIVAVTGAAGFIGSHVVAALLGRGDTQVLGIDALTDYYDPRVKLARINRLNSPRFTFFADDLTQADLSRIVGEASVILHLAGQGGVRPSWGGDFRTYLERNIMATQRLLEFAARRGAIDRFVYASSSSVYGNADRYPVTEADLPRPFSPYGVTKLAGEHLCGLYGENYGVPTVSLRYFTVYGPGQRPDMAFSRFIQAAMNDEEITVHGDGSQVRDFTYVGDVVAANLAAAFIPDLPPGGVFNICGGSAVTISTVLQTLGHVTGKTLRVHHTGTKAGDVYRTGGSSRAAHEVLGWAPQTTLRDGLRAQWHAAAEEQSARRP
jgi:UDP-glucuronate 4-epimerase